MIEQVQDLKAGSIGTLGPQGLSAYQIYLANGGTLSETEWLNSLKGEKGDDYILTEKDKTEISNETYQAMQPELIKIGNNINTVEEKIPNQASSINQLADKDFVNSSLNSITAFYITKDSTGNQFDSKEELDNSTTFYSGGEIRVPTRNDYCIVLEDETKENATTRYIYQNNQWEFQYVVNETPLTSEQVKALNSGITLELVAKLQGIDLTDYVKNTDYATTSVNKGGVVKLKSYNWIDTNASGELYCYTRTYQQYESGTESSFISKGTLENVITGKELVDKTYVDDAIGGALDGSY